ncbi:MAG: ABC transporter ATP-binding protein [Candidatus Omnitrophota bacterium]
MNNNIAIDVKNLSKAFKIYAKPADMFWEVLTAKPKHREFWALKDVSFEVKRGEVVGVVGRNGAGKSTLLKILTGTLDRTCGSVKVNGKISAILELGTGFSGEYTGRENIHMGGLCMGMSREEINRKIGGIIEFSELGSVIDQPFKTYSSGMQARLTFSVAVSVEPDIFIIDEALSVGDTLFAEKCFNRIRKITQNGATVFFVTHSLNSIYELCNTAILLHQGRLICRDEPRHVGYRYEQILNEERALVQKQENVITTIGDLSGVASAMPSPVYVKNILIFDEAYNKVNTLTYDKKYYIRATVFADTDYERLSVGFRIQKPGGGVLYGLASYVQNVFVSIKAGQEQEVEFELVCNLASGQYFLCCGIAHMPDDGNFTVLHHAGDAYVFNVESTGLFQGDFDMKGIAKVKENSQHAKH